MGTLRHDLGRELTEYLNTQQSFKRSGRVLDITKIDQGWETEIHTFTFEYRDGNAIHTNELILRIYASDDADAKSTKEFRAMTKLYQMGFPVPKVYCLETEPSVLGKPFVIMEKINGQSMAKIIDNSPMETIDRMVKIFCKIFVNLHRLDKEPFLSDRSLFPDPSVYVEGEPDYYLSNMLRNARQMDIPYKKEEFEQILDWLEQKMDNISLWRLSPIHLDYHFNNVLVNSDGKSFVIDWTNFGIADYRIDLAWTLLLTSTYGHPEARDYILRTYENIAGHKVEDIEYFEVVAAARRLYSIVASLLMGPEKLGMRPEAAEMMKSQPGHVNKVAEVLRDRTGINVSGFDDLF